MLLLDSMNIPYWIWPIALAPFIGSFLGAVIKRVEQPHSIVLGRSSFDLAPYRLERFAGETEFPETLIL